MRLIDADKIVEVAEHAYNEWNLAMAAADGQREINKVFKIQELCKAVKAVADNAPTIKAVEVRHGKWIQHLKPELDWIRYEQECSVCHETINVVYGSNYCPNCGALMDGDTL